MILFAQELVGLKNLMAEPGAKKHTPSETQSDLLFQESVSDEQSFLNLLADLIKHQESPNEKDIFVDSEECSKKELFNFIISTIKPDSLSGDNLPESLDTENFIESFIRTPAYPDVAREIMSSVEKPEYQIRDTAEENKISLVELATFLKKILQDNDQSGKTELSPQLPGGKVLSKTVPHQAGETNTISLSSKPETSNSLEIHPLLNNQPFDKDIPRQSILAAGNIGSLETKKTVRNQNAVVENQDNQKSETIRELQTQKAETIFKPDRHNLSSEPSQKVFENNLMLKSMPHHIENDSNRPETVKSDSEHFSDKNSSMKETRTDQDLRQILNFVNRETNGKPMDNNPHSDEAIIKFAETESTIQKDGQLPKNITVDQAKTNLQVPKQSDPSATATLSQTLSTLNIHESGSDQNIRINQIDPAMARDFQQVENSVISQVINRLFAGIRQGNSNMTIFLHPPELGKVKVRIVTEKGGMNITLHPKNHQVVEILQKHLPVLQHSLQDQEIAISGLRVSIEFDNHSESTAEQQEFKHSDRNGTTTRLSEEDRNTVVPADKTDWANPDQGFSLRV